MELIPQGYIARYTMEDLSNLVAENLKKLGKELTKPVPVSQVVGGKTVWLFECNDSQTAPQPKRKYSPRKVQRGEPLRQQSENTGDEVLDESVRPL